MAVANNKAVNVPATKLLIRLSGSTPNALEWVEYDGCGYSRVQSSNKDQLPEIAARPASGCTHLVIPAQKATSRIIVIPDENYELTDQKLQWLADETLTKACPRCTGRYSLGREREFPSLALTPTGLCPSFVSLPGLVLTSRMRRLTPFACQPVKAAGRYYQTAVDGCSERMRTVLPI
jgi:hypothetical protein